MHRKLKLIFSSLWYEISGSCLLSFCQNERIYLSQYVYFLRKVHLLFNFWMIECTAMFYLTQLCILSFKNWKINTLSSKSIQIEKAKFSHFDRTRGDKNQIFRTYVAFHEFSMILCPFLQLISPIYLLYPLICTRSIESGLITYKDPIFRKCFKILGYKKVLH